MDRPIDSPQWADRVEMEIQRLVSTMPRLKTQADAQTANAQPSLSVESPPHETSPSFEWLAT